MTSPTRAVRIVREAAALTEVELAALQGLVPDGALGLRARLDSAVAGESGAGHAVLEARSAGLVRPTNPGWPRSEPTDVCRIDEVTCLPGCGALIRLDGTAPSAPAGGSLVYLTHLAETPSFVRNAEGFVFTPPGEPEPIARAGVFLPWGAVFNYGHFLLDALPSLLALEEAGLIDGWPPIAPRLRPWQRELVGLLLGDRRAVRELAAPAVELDQAVYATSMDHFLHAPNALLLRMRERVARRVGGSPTGAKRVYLSRRSHRHPMRILLNELELERALASRGFAIVRPERLSPTAQIALARGAEVIVGQTGAGMANALFAAPGARVIEIQPQIFTSAWVGAFGELVGHDWWTYYAQAPAPEAEVPWVRRARRGFRFAYHLPLQDFLAFVDARL